MSSWAVLFAVSWAPSRWSVYFGLQTTPTAWRVHTGFVYERKGFNWYIVLTLSFQARAVCDHSVNTNTLSACNLVWLSSQHSRFLHGREGNGDLRTPRVMADAPDFSTPPLNVTYTLYKPDLPAPATAFSSATGAAEHCTCVGLSCQKRTSLAPGFQQAKCVCAGKQIFAEALAGGTAASFFNLIEVFSTQDEPAFCGLASLAMVLNSLAIGASPVQSRYAPAHTLWTICA